MIDNWFTLQTSCFFVPNFRKESIMTIYVTKDNSKFIRVFNMPYQSADLLDDLCIKGFNYSMFDDTIVQRYNQKNMANLAAAMDYLPEQKEQELVNTCLLMQNQEKIDDIKDYKSNLSYLTYWLHNLTADQLVYVLSYLNKHLSSHNWHSWMIRGTEINDRTLVWIFDENQLPIDPYEKFEYENKYDYIGSSWSNILDNIFYSTCVRLMECDEHGNSAEEQADNSWLLAGYAIPDQTNCDNNHDEDLDHFMLVNYQMMPAKVRVTYSAS